MPREVQIEELRAGVKPHRNRDLPIQLYYDETNNIRSLTLEELGLNVLGNQAFVIAGVALMPGCKISGWDQLRKLLRIQPSAKEIKFEHVAKGGYEDALGSRKLALFMQWLLDQKIMIHYSTMDPLYWSVLDIIESMQTDDRMQLDEYHSELKNELHHAVLQDLEGFLSLLYSFSYPDVPREQVRPFLEAVRKFVDGCLPEDRNAATFLLRRILNFAARLPGLELTFLHNNKPGALIDNFSTQFMQCMYTFKNAVHVFDRETFIEKALAPFELRDGEYRLNYRFADSKAEVGIQLSDVVAGLIGRHFTYLQDHSLTELMRRKAGFTEVQQDNLTRLRTLIDRSDAFSDGLFHALMPWDTHFKNNAFLHEQEVPSFMW